MSLLVFSGYLPIFVILQNQKERKLIMAIFRMLAVALFFLAFFPLYAKEKPGKDKEVIKLWPNEVPLLMKDNQETERWDKWGVINVNNPTLTIYPADKKKANGMAILVIPGGGYRQVCINHEGHRIGDWFSSHGVSAFVLKYRCKPYKHPVPLMDAQRALRWIRINAKKYDIDPNKIGVIGFSAGGHLASSLSVHYAMKTREPKDRIDSVSARPDFAVLLYPVISMDPKITHRGSRNNLIGGKPEAKMAELMSTEKQVTKNTPPTYLVHGKADRGVKPKNSELFYEALKKNQVPTELLYIEKGGHGFGLGGGWPDKCLKWLKAILPSKTEKL